MQRARPLGAVVLAVIASLFYWNWLSNAESRAVGHAASWLSHGDWGALYGSAISDEPRLMECDRHEFVAMMSALQNRASYSYRSPKMAAEVGGRTVAYYVVEVADSTGKIHENTLSFFVAHHSRGYSVSIGDLAFQLALLGPGNVRENLQFLATIMREAGVGKLLNPREMIVTSPDRIETLLDRTPAAEQPDPGAAWTRLSGF